MAVTNYAVVYSSTSGQAIAAFRRTTSDNTATWKTDGHLTVDGVRVMEGTTGAAAEFEATILDLGAELAQPVTPGSHEVDEPSAPTTIVERTDGGRDPLFPYAE